MNDLENTLSRLNIKVEKSSPSALKVSTNHNHNKMDDIVNSFERLTNVKDEKPLPSTLVTSSKNGDTIGDIINSFEHSLRVQVPVFGQERNCKKDENLNPRKDSCECSHCKWRKEGFRPSSEKIQSDKDIQMRDDKGDKMTKSLSGRFTKKLL